MTHRRLLRGLCPGLFGLASLGVAACSSCGHRAGDASPTASAQPGPPAVAESAPRCRSVAGRLVLGGEDVAVGDVAVGASELLLGLVTLDGGKRVASLLRTSLDLAASRQIDLGTPLGDDPPPSPRWKGSVPYVAFFARPSRDAGARLRELDIARVGEGGIEVEGTIAQQADESTAFDVAWNDAGAGLVAWDEDAPLAGDASPPVAGDRNEGRGLVKVQALGSSTRRVASPETSDAEAPRLLARADGGFWLAWLARRAEERTYADEGPGERRAFRWVEVVAMTATGDVSGPARRVSPERGRAATFELGRHGRDLVVMVQDEAARVEGAGARIVRYVVGDAIDSNDVVDGGVGSTLADLVPSEGAVRDGGVARWLAWIDGAERTHLTPLGVGLDAIGPATAEPSLDGARLLAAVAPNDVVALAFPAREGDRARVDSPELRRYFCPAGEVAR